MKEVKKLHENNNLAYATRLRAMADRIEESDLPVRSFWAMAIYSTNEIENEYEHEEGIHVATLAGALDMLRHRIMQETWDDEDGE